MKQTESPTLAYRRLDPWKAANQRLELEESIMPDALLPRWLEEVEESGPVAVSLQFGWDEQKRIRVRGQVEVTARVPCQRCLESMAIDLTAAIDAAVVTSEEAASQLPAEIDPWLCEQERINLFRMLEDELLLALPMMAVHELAGCTGRSSFSSSAPEQENPEQSEKQRPFAQLADLMKKTNN